MATRKSSPSDVHHLHHFYGTRATQIRTAIEPHRAWIETKLGVPLPDTVILHSDIGFHNAAIQRLLGYIDPKAPITTARARVADLVQSVEMPHGHIPLYDLTVHRVSGRSDESLIYGAEDAWAYEIEWTDGPVLLQLRNLPTAVIALYAAYHGGPESNDESRQDILMLPKNGLEALISMLKSLHISDGKARLKVGHSPARAITECSWDSLTLDTAIVSLLRDDFEMFFERERWFRDMGLPFRPAPSIIVLEDIDRVFPRTGQSRSQVSLQALLNALDGVASGEGIITVATANEPTALDPAILKRPGRFDRVVCFPLPSPELRHQYFRKLNLSFDFADFETVVEETDAMSFAQLREIHIM